MPAAPARASPPACASLSRRLPSSYTPGIQGRTIHATGARSGGPLNIILAATDFSKRSDRAVRRAAMLAAAGGARLDLVHVVDDDQPERLVAAEREAAQAILDETLRDWPELRGIEGRALVALGEPFDAIVRSVQESAADLVVLGAHRRALLRDIFTGTTAERVMRTGHAPVLMVNTEPAGPYRKSLAG
ncbi:MAG: hypothetical protein C3F17_02190, partial [Bradyrhizobiaceae bacterium]